MTGDRVLATTLLACSHGCVAFAAGAALLFAAAGHSEDGEFVLLAGSFGVLLPAGVASAVAQTRSIERGGGTAVPTAVVACAGAFLVLISARFADRVDAGGWRVVAPAGAVLYAVCLAWLTLRPSALRRGPAPALLLGLVPVAIVAFVGGTTTGGRVLAATAFATLGALVVVRGPHAARSPRRRLALDVAICAALTLVAMDVFVHYTPGANTEHPSYWLGPANDILQGKAPLQETFTQYGVGSMYFLAAAFSVVPIGFGGFSLVVSTLTALQFLLLYAILRAATRSQLLPAVGTAAAVAINVYGYSASYVDFPNGGPLRFGLPLVVLGCLVFAHRSARPVVFKSLALASLAAASLWSFETFLYSAAAYSCFVVVDSLLLCSTDPSAGVRHAARRLVSAVAACATTHLAFAIGMRVVSGGWPDWGSYLELVTLYSSGGFFTLPVPAWSGGLLLAAAYFAALVTAAATVAARLVLPGEGRVKLAAIAGFAGLGVVMLTYWLGRSEPDRLFLVAIPAVGAAALAVHTALQVMPSRVLRTATVGVVLWIALLAAAQGRYSEKWDYTPVAALVDPSVGLGDRLDTLWSSPPVDPRVEAAQRLLARARPRERPVVLLEPDLTTELLVRTERPHALPMSNAGDSLLDSSVDRALAAARSLRSGTDLLTMGVYWGAVRSGAVNEMLALPEGDPDSVAAVSTRRGTLELRVLRELAARFELRLVDSESAPGAAVGELVTLRIGRRRS